MVCKQVIKTEIENKNLYDILQTYSWQFTLKLKFQTYITKFI
jgi:hypothetical protein